MKISGWGRFPSIEAKVEPISFFDSFPALASGELGDGIPRGAGRSYGDSALSDVIFDCTSNTRFLSFDDSSGVLRCQAGVTLDDILRVFVSRGWFLPVTPGTKYVTVGGAIANDVHGKNHHIDGCFSECVLGFELLTGNGELVYCSKTENVEMFQATCGGCGLTGVIVTVELQLLPISSAYLYEKTIRTKDLKETFELFERNLDIPYSVAWIDCLTRGKALGRSVLMLGQHISEENTSLVTHHSPKLSIPVDFPKAVLNPLSIKAFNTLYYASFGMGKQSYTCHYDKFFYPLDGIQRWNRMYGKQGFLQYQFVLPLTGAYEGIRDILSRITDSGLGSFLAVLKRMGKQNSNYLSFPMEGYTLALDFKYSHKAMVLMDELDKQVLDYGGRIYLAKDSRMNEAVFKASYPDWEKFCEIREATGGNQRFNSLQSRRLGI